MTTESSQGGIGRTAFNGLLLIVLGCGLEAIFPTVQVSCPARTASAPDCDLRSRILFDQVTIRHKPLPALQPIKEIEYIRSPRSRGGSPTLFFDTAAGRVSATATWADQLSLQKDLQEPLRAYLANPSAPATVATMRPTLWEDPGGDAANRMVRKTHPATIAARALTIGGLLFWIWLPVQLVMSFSRRARA